MRLPGRQPGFFERLRGRRAVAGLALTVVFAFGVGGCSDDDDGAIPTTSTTGRATTTSTSSGATSTSTTGSTGASAEEQEIAARYTAFWDARFEANTAPVNPEEPALREFGTGPQLENVITETTRNRDQGLAFRRPDDSVYERRVRVVSVEGDVARLQDCATNDGIIYRVASGEVVDDSVSTRSIEAVMRRVDGEWRLESTRVLQEWEGVAGCALAPDS